MLMKTAGEFDQAIKIIDDIYLSLKDDTEVKDIKDLKTKLTRHYIGNSVTWKDFGPHVTRECELAAAVHANGQNPWKAPKNLRMLLRLSRYNLVAQRPKR